MSLRHFGPSRPAVLLLLALGALGVSMSGQGTTAPGQGAPRADQRADPFAGLTFRNIGPATMGGRIDDLAVLETNPAVFYVGTATGGLWKTTNNGTTWEVLFDDLDDVVSIGDIAITPDDANTVWVGSGENNNRQSGSWGNGVYKSTDGGQTWKHMGLRDSKHIARIIIDPIDHDVVYVAALGSLYGPGKERGVFKTTDGGLTWTNVLFVNEDTGATELVQDPANNKVLYAATYQRRRATWGFNGGGPGSAIYKTQRRRPHLDQAHQRHPAGPLGRIGMDVYRKNPNVVYARIEHETESGTYRSDDAGSELAQDVGRRTRGRCTSARSASIRPTISASTCSASQLHISDDGGKTFIENGVDALRPSRDVDQSRTIRTTSSTATTAASGSATTRVKTGKASTTWISASPTTSATTWRRRTTCAAGCRTTTPGAGRARCAAATASSTTTGRRSRAATASRPSSIPPIRASSTPSRRTATSCASIA